MAIHPMRWPLILAAFALFWSAPSVSQGKSEAKISGKVNLNTASAEQLVLLPGVGPVTAERIIEARRQRLFERPWEVTRVKGIGPKLYRKLEAHLSVEGTTNLKREQPLRTPKSPKKKKGGKRKSSRVSPPSGPKIIDFRTGRSPSP